MAKKLDSLLEEIRGMINENTPPIKLNACETVIDPKRFVDSFEFTLKQNSGNKKFMHFYLRLLKYRDELEKQNINRSK